MNDLLNENILDRTLGFTGVQKIESVVDSIGLKGSKISTGEVDKLSENSVIKNLTLKIGNNEDTFVEQISEIFNYYGFYAKNANECLELLMQVCERVNDFEIKEFQLEIGKTYGN